MVEVLRRLGDHGNCDADQRLAMSRTKLPMHPDMLGGLENYVRPDGTVKPTRDRVLRKGRDTGPPVSDQNVDAYWECIYFEAKHPSDPTGRYRSTASLYSIAKHICEKWPRRLTDNKSAQELIRPWRKHRHYRRQVALSRTI